MHFTIYVNGGQKLLSQTKFKNRCLVPSVQVGSATNSLCDLGCVILNVAPCHHFVLSTSPNICYTVDEEWPLVDLH